MLTFSLSLTSCSNDAPYDRADSETNFVLIDVKGKGQIVVELYPNVAPITVANFKKLVSQNFYDGLIFHRVISGFMIQGGDPEGTGYGGSDKKILGEFSLNGFENNLYHRRGVISMARGGSDMNSASSQFFIVHKTNANNTKSLDGKYASFGYVVYGIDVVDEIATVRTNSSDKPVSPVKITSAKFATVTK
jgi:peptidyl-prolyl cis-trans isomerase B (cyclophilin B)